MRPRSVAPALTALCKCGCGGSVKQMMVNGRPILYKPGHWKVTGGEPKYSEILTCPTCKKEFQRKHNAKYCSRQCYWKVRGAIYDPSRSGRAGSPFADRSTFRVVSSPRIQREYLLRQRDTCDHCGWGEYVQVLEMHHVNGNKRDGEYENLVLLCPTCHEVEHFLKKTGRHDNTRYARAKELRERLGLSRLPSGLARTSLQELSDKGLIMQAHDI